MDALLQDLRYALRQLARSPGFTLAAVLTLGLGIGATTAIFSVVDGVLLRPAPFVDMDRLAMVWETDRKSGTSHEPASVPDFQDFQRRSAQFAQLAAFAAGEVNLTPTQGEPARLAALAVSHELLPMLGVRPLVGRTFTADEDAPGNAARVVLISEDLWQRAFARDRDVVGRTLRIDDAPWTVIGVLSAGAEFGTLQVLRAADYSRGFADRGGQARVDAWVPLRADPVSLPRDTHPIFVVGRLAADADLSTAQQELAGIAADLERTYQVNDARGVSIQPLTRVVFGPVRATLLVLLGAVALVLLIACANVANLLLARGAARSREITVRRAIGATTRRLARQFLVESALLTTAGAAFGVLLALQGVALLTRLAPVSIPRVGAVGVDARVLAVTLGVSVLVAIAFGVLPTLQARNRDIQASLHGAATRGGSAGREQRRLRSGFVVAELALAVMLMVGAGLLIRTLWRLGTVDPGFRTAGVLKAEYQLPSSRYPRDFAVWPRWTQVQRFNDDLQRRLEALPGVEAVALAANHPVNAGFTSSIAVVGREAEAADWPEPAIRIVTSTYFGALGVPLLTGRYLETTDAVDAPAVVVINEAARRRFFPRQDPLGQRIALWGAERLVVGVVGNERFRGLMAATPPGLYLPLTQVPVADGGHTVLVRVHGDLAALTPALRRVVANLDPELPLFGVEPLAATLSNTVAQQRFTMIVLVVFAGVALLLAVIGVYGLLSYTVTQRTREIGIRMALGAEPRRVRDLVVGQGAMLAGAGLVLGLAGALALTRVLTTLLYGVGARDPLTLVGVALTLGLVALLASDVAARRAARLDPMVALRTE
ncbi:MAG: ABC transporter permease [Gemmatimonadota bacterium]